MSLRKLLIWGTGDACKSFLETFEMRYARYYMIVGFIDSSKHLQDKYMWGQRIYSPEEVCTLEWDNIIICTYRTDFQEEILESIRQLNIDESKVSCYSKLHGINLLKPFIINKYQDTDDSEIRDILNYLQQNELSIFNQYVQNTGVKYKVYQEQDDDPYILIDGKRMYYPRETLNIEYTPYLTDVFSEQSPNSPHLYVRSDNDIPPNAVIVDAGVKEGNFSINYADKAKKIYLIECEKIWCRVLKKTFAPFRNKVVLCDKYLSQKDDVYNITLDSLINENIDFLKMDIEGAEIEALLGGKEILTNSRANLAICAYHNSNDEKDIRNLLEQYGYETEVSKGYMAFIWDEKFYQSLDFRRGIVYGYKQNIIFEEMSI